MTNNKNSRLQKLKGSDYEIKDGEPDIRGWDVKDSSGKKIGKVDDLIFDTQSRKVRYIILSPVKDLDLSSKYVLMPIGLGELHTKDDDVIVPGVTTDQLRQLPEYNDNMTLENEAAINNVFATGAGAGIAGAAYGTYNDYDDLYSHDNYNENNLFKNRKKESDTTIPVIEENLQVGKQTVQTGGVYIKSKIVEQPVKETVNLKEEHVTVNRTPVDRVINSNDLSKLKDETIELTEHAEVPVVSKEARVVEEISLDKQVTEREEKINETVKHTEVDVEDLNKNDSSTGTLY